MEQTERIIQDYPHLFNDDIDKWLFREFGISGGACSSIESIKYSVARKVAEKAMAYAKEQLMANAVDAVVKIDAGGYPYVDRTIELYDYDKDIPLAKRGDKYKVILIKEE